MLSTILLFCLLFLLKCKRQVNCFYVAFLWESDVALVWQNQYCVRKIDSTWTLSKGKHNWIEKRNSLTNCQLLTYLKAQHHFTAICWPLSVFFSCYSIGSVSVSWSMKHDFFSKTERFRQTGHWWFSGRILTCHAGGPVSIPGQCKTVSQGDVSVPFVGELA